jgi:peptide chain release factor 3
MAALRKRLSVFLHIKSIQLYKTYLTDEYIIGAVGQLQFEVFQHRMLNEYNAEVVMTPMGNIWILIRKPAHRKLIFE